MDYKKPGPPSKPVIAPPSSYSTPTPSAPNSKTQQMVDRDNELYGDTVPAGSFGITKKSSSPKGVHPTQIKRNRRGRRVG